MLQSTHLGHADHWTRSNGRETLGMKLKTILAWKSLFGKPKLLSDPFYKAGWPKQLVDQVGSLLNHQRSEAWAQAKAQGEQMWHCLQEKIKKTKRRTSIEWLSFSKISWLISFPLVQSSSPHRFERCCANTDAHHPCTRWSATCPQLIAEQSFCPDDTPTSFFSRKTFLSQREVKANEKHMVHRRCSYYSSLSFHSDVP